MKKFPILFIISIMVISLIFIMNHNPFKALKKSFHVTCTTTFLADAVKHIAGNTVQITTLMNPGIDPHLYKATEQDMHAIAQADLIFYHGLHLEGKMAELFKAMQHYKKTFAACNTLDCKSLLSTEYDHCYDPHIWFSIPLWLTVVQNLSTILSNQLPHHANLYRKNADDYCLRLKETHEYICNKTQEIPSSQRVLITAHDAFGYFGKTYGFTVIGLQGISTDADISTACVQEIATYIVKHNVETIFTELGIPRKSIQALEQAVARFNKKVFIGPELYTDSLGDSASPASTYIHMMRYTIDTLVTALKTKE